MRVGDKTEALLGATDPMLNTQGLVRVTGKALTQKRWRPDQNVSTAAVVVRVTTAGMKPHEQKASWGGMIYLAYPSTL